MPSVSASSRTSRHIKREKESRKKKVLLLKPAQRAALAKVHPDVLQRADLLPAGADNKNRIFFSFIKGMIVKGHSFFLSRIAGFFRIQRIVGSPLFNFRSRMT